LPEIIKKDGIAIGCCLRMCSYQKQPEEKNDRGQEHSFVRHNHIFINNLGLANYSVYL